MIIAERKLGKVACCCHKKDGKPLIPCGSPESRLDGGWWYKFFFYCSECGELWVINVKDD